MALGMRSDKTAETAPAATFVAPVEEKPEAKPVTAGLVFEDTVVPGRGQTETVDPEYQLLKDKVAEHWRGVKNGTVTGNNGVAFNSPTAKKHVGMLRKAAAELKCGISIRPSNPADIPVGPARIQFRTKPAKVYNKDNK